jgi:uncharacterized protein (TIGR04222 family)
MFPFNLSASAFLLLYPLPWVASLVGFALYEKRRDIQRQAATSMGLKGRLDRYQIAWLCGGARAAFAAALTRLAERELVRVDGDQCLPAPEATTELARGPALHRVEAEVLRQLPHGLERAFKSFSGSPLGLRRELEARGLSQGQRKFSEVAGPFGLLWLGLLALGVARLLQGLSKDRPVGYLILEMIVAAGVCVGLVSHLALPRITASGQRLLRQLRARGRPNLSRSAMGDSAGGADPGLAVALFGTAVLMQSELEPVHLAARRLVNDRKADGGTACGGWDGVHGSGSDSSSGSSDGGGGDGGGGGCGGCGS